MLLGEGLVSARSEPPLTVALAPQSVGLGTNCIVGIAVGIYDSREPRQNTKMV